MAPRIVDVRTGLGDAEYPAELGDLIAEAYRNGADDELLEVLHLLPGRRYRDAAEVLEELRRRGLLLLQPDGPATRLLPVR